MVGVPGLGFRGKRMLLGNLLAGRHQSLAVIILILAPKP